MVSCSVLSSLYMYSNHRLVHSSGYKTNFQFSVKSNTKLCWFCFSLQFDLSRKLVPLNQSGTKLKPITTWWPLRASGSLVVFTLSSR